MSAGRARVYYVYVCVSIFFFNVGRCLPTGAGCVQLATTYELLLVHKNPRMRSGAFRPGSKTWTQ